MFQLIAAYSSFLLLISLATLISGYEQTIHWFDQRIDHFSSFEGDSNLTKTFQQRYFVVDDFWSGSDGPIILHICGEYTCEGVKSGRLFIVDLAKMLGAKIVSLEHRYFGESQPFNDLSVENLRFLSSKQAVYDLAFFTKNFQNQLNGRGNPQNLQNPWIVIGGSYPGALAAWYRVKFPHLSIGSLSSSGVVHAILNFTAFDEQVSRSAGKDCSDALRKATKQIEEDFESSKKAFKASALSSHDFLYLAADSAAEAIQYGHRHVLCNRMLDASDGLSFMERFANFTVGFFYEEMGNDLLDYDSSEMANPSVDPLRAGRQWWWMKCTELAYFQVAPSVDNIRSSQVDLTWHHEMCKSLFGSNLSWPPKVGETNLYFGGEDIEVSNVVFTNGIEDPWQWAGIREKRIFSRQYDAELVRCDSCAHCVDLSTPAETDPPELKHARFLFKVRVEEWLSLFRNVQAHVQPDVY